MYMRLGFAVAIHVDPDVLLVDEVLAVGDEAFTHKCLDKFAEFRRRGRTVLLVTHSLDLVTRFCDEALWLDGGLARAQGDPKRVIDAYLTEVVRDRDRGRCQRADEVRATRERSRSSSNPPARHVPGGRGTLGLARGRDRRRRARRRDRPAVARVPVGRARRDPAALRAATLVQDVVVGVGIFNAEGVVLLRHQHAHRGRGRRRDGRRRRGPLRHRQPRPRRGHLQARRRGAPRERRAVRLPPPALHVPRDLAVKEAGIFRPPHRWTFSGGVRMQGLP